jgi:hypothetical protein
MRIRALYPILVVGGLACRTVPSWQASAERARRAAVDQLVLSAPLLLAAGDSATAVLTHQVGAYQFRLSLPAAETWTTVSSTDPGVLTADAAGHLLAVAPGTTSIRARVEEEDLSLAVRVLPAIATLRFHPRDTTIQVGDTVLLRLEAYDSSGALVPAPVFIAHRILTRPQPLRYGRVRPPASLLLIGCTPGSEWFGARLGHRADSVTISVSSTNQSGRAGGCPGPG